MEAEVLQYVRGGGDENVEYERSNILIKNEREVNPIYFPSQSFRSYLITSSS